MRRFFRPVSLLVTLILAAIAAAAILLLRATDESKPRPLTVGKNEHEIAWLSYANNSTAWERFVKGITTGRNSLAQGDSALTLNVEAENAFPAEITDIPEVVLSVVGVAGKMRVRWYKLTSQWKAEDWVAQLVRRNPPPLAIIGGPFTNTAIRISRDLEDYKLSLGNRAPLFLVAAATKTRLTDQVIAESTDEAIENVVAPYEDHTFRFCFNNKKLTDSLCNFIWSHPELRPTCPNYYVASWEEDPYSQDLLRRFNETLRSPARRRGVELYLSNSIYNSVGTFDRPNPEECELAQLFLDDLATQEQLSLGLLAQTLANPHCSLASAVAQGGIVTSQAQAFGRPLLVLSGQFQPSRRVLRAVARLAPGQCTRFVVAAGDAISFNTIYRDRNVNWPIQDYPCDLVVFSHRNPVEPSAGFLELKGGEEQVSANEGSNSGTEDVLVNVDIVEALVLAAYPQGGAMAENAEQVRQVLREVRWDREHERVSLSAHDPPLFDKHGDRHNDTGERIIWLKPLHARGFDQPRATLRVYQRISTDPDSPWNKVWEDRLAYDVTH